MPENRNTENPPLDAEDWESAFEPYQGHTGAALQLGFLLNALRDFLYEDPLDAESMSEAIDRALDALYRHTDFHLICREFFRKVVEGDMTLVEEEMLKKLGIKF